MASYMRSVRRICAFESQFFAARRTGVALDSRRYVRGLRRKPVRVIVPQSETDKVPKKTPQSQPGGQNIKNKTDVKAAAHTRRAAENNAVPAQNQVKAVHFTVTKDHVDGLRYERALPGDKRLG